ncbi:MAG: 30S ribosomal protein S17e [Candidatus Aenigmatarchaeota archaeon]
MGRVRTRDIKNLALKILEQHRDKFTTDFEKNKQIINQLYYFYSKKIRNKIVGYITKLVKKSSKAS